MVILKREELMFFDVKALNDRIYSLENNLETVNGIIGRVAEHNIYGEQGIVYSTSISLRNASHMISKVWLEGDKMYGEVKILETKYGKLLKQSLEQDNIVFRPRMWTRFDSDDNDVKINNITTFDAIPRYNDDGSINDEYYYYTKHYKKLFLKNIQ